MPSPRDMKPKVQRTYSDPDLPQLLPLPVRPSSSYEPRPKHKEHSAFDQEVMDAMADKLNLDVVKHKDFRWVVRDCLLALRDENYTCRISMHGDLEFVDTFTEEARVYHPIVDAHQQLAKRLLDVQRDLEMKRLDPQYRVRHNVYLAIMGEKDVRRVCTPKLIEDIMTDLDVDPLGEPFLIERIKVSIEDCYFRMMKIGADKITIENCIDVESLVVNLELDRFGFMKKVSPSGLVYCVECMTSLGDVISSGCHDVFCYACAVETHSKGKRQDSPMVFIEQAVCAECTSMAALVRCQDCVELFCYDCFKQTHARGKRQRHCVSLPQRTFCFECDAREASYICVECEDALCTRCSANIHRTGARQNHSLFGIRKAAYNKKLFADNLDRLTGILGRNIERSYSLSPWFIFYDHALSPSWYNFKTCYTVRADPNNLTVPPKEEGPPKMTEDGTDGDADIFDIPASADEQALLGLPGSTILKDTHAAKFTGMGACFDVPPPISVKYLAPHN